MMIVFSTVRGKSRMGRAKLFDHGGDLGDCDHEPVDDATRNLVRKLTTGRSRRRPIENDRQDGSAANADANVVAIVGRSRSPRLWASQ